MKEKNVKQILNEYSKKFDVEEVTFFEEDRVLYSGSYQEFVKTSNQDIVLFMEMKRIMGKAVIQCISFNHKKLFIFI